MKILALIMALSLLGCQAGGQEESSLAGKKDKDKKKKKTADADVTVDIGYFPMPTPTGSEISLD